MIKLYTRIVWENFPSEKSPLNEANLNRMDLALDNIDNRVVEMDATKVSKDVANNLVKTWSIDEETGIITVEHLNGSRDIFDLNIEKIPVNFELSKDGILTMTTDDGSKYTANIGAMIPVLTFNDSDTIAVSVIGTGVNKTYSFSIKSGSVTEDKLQPNFLADVKTEVAKAQASQSASAQSASAASSSATLAESYTHGGTGAREGEDADNARYYMEQAKAVSAVNVATTETAGIVKPDGDTITVDPDGTIRGQSKVSEMTGATAEANGTSGTVPAPKAGQQAHILGGDGTWKSPLDNEIIAAKIKELNKAIEDAMALRASLEVYGLVKVTNSSAVTDPTGLALAATEKNASIDGTLANQVSQLSNPNLLINPDFKINQRGGKIVESGKNYYSDESCGTLVSTTTSAYTATKISNGNYSISIDSTTYYVKASDVVDGYCEDWKYGYDRWRLSANGENPTYYENGYITTTFILQYIENPERFVGCNLTMSAMIDDGTILVITSNIENLTSEWHRYAYTEKGSNSIGIITENGKLEVQCAGKIKWVKLELGSVATPFVPPDPASELYKCQRYYEYFFVNSFLNKSSNDDGHYELNIPYINKRVNPTIQYTGSDNVFIENTSIYNCSARSFVKNTYVSDITIDAEIY